MPRKPRQRDTELSVLRLKKSTKSIVGKKKTTKDLVSLIVPPKEKKIDIELIKKLASLGFTCRALAVACGVTIDSFLRIKKLDPKVSAAYAEGLTEHLTKTLVAINNEAFYQGNVQAQIFLLKSVHKIGLDPKSRNKKEKEAKVPEEIEHLQKMTQKELDQKIKEAQKKISVFNG